MSLFSKKPKSIADFEKEIEKLRQKKKLSARNSERLEEYEKQLSTLKTAEEAAQKKKARQKKIAIGSIAASLLLSNTPAVASVERSSSFGSVLRGCSTSVFSVACAVSDW